MQLANEDWHAANSGEVGGMSLESSLYLKKEKEKEKKEKEKHKQYKLKMPMAIAIGQDLLT